MDELKILKMLSPKGILWNYGEKFNHLLECFSNRIKELRNYQNDIVRESQPYTASDTITDWLAMYEIKTTNDALLDAKLLRLYSKAFGGQSVDYFNDLIKEEYSHITVELESDKTTIKVTGEISTRIEYLVFIGFCEKIFPAYCVIQYSIEVLENYGQYAICGIAICGVSICGYIGSINKEGEENENK